MPPLRRIGIRPGAASRDRPKRTRPMIELKFPDGAVREYPAGSTARDVAAAISPSLAKKAVLAELNGEQRDLNR
ncbi:MAG: TGS domain-containing protein, partial [Brevundimonas sp.]|uniref:TGS domain-containing protein n=1 Tax=Brevundimonas sp. TaxID=1871086 RepID=UPI004033A3A8